MKTRDVSRGKAAGETACPTDAVLYPFCVFGQLAVTQLPVVAVVQAEGKAELDAYFSD